ncbi:MAG: hypothetical protein V1833_00755, partial [Elusimicrobiota bacterium]
AASTGTLNNLKLSTYTATGFGVSIATNVYIVGYSSAAKFYGDGGGLFNVTATTIPASISVSTINATATTSYGGINITTNTYIQGNIGIGTTNSTGKFAVFGQVPGNYTMLVSTASDGTAYNLCVSSSGNIGIGTTNPVAKLDVDGSVNISFGNKFKINNYEVMVATATDNKYYATYAP